MELAEGQSLHDDIYTWNCKNSEFCDPDYDQIITGYLPLIKNQKLRKRSTNVPKSREPQSLNYSRCEKEIDLAIEKAFDLLEALD